MKKIMTLMIIIVIFCVWFGMTSYSWAQEKNFMKIYSGSAGGSYYNIATILADILNKYVPEVSASPAVGSALGSGKAVGAGEAKVGLTMTCTDYKTYRGLPPRDKQYEKIRLLGTLGCYSYHLIVSKNSPIKAISDLKTMKGLKIVTALRGSTGAAGLDVILDVYGITKDVLKANKSVILYTSISDGGGMLQNGQADVFAHITAAPNAICMGFEMNPGIRFLSIDEEHMKKIRTAYPFWLEVKLPKEAYPKSLSEDIPTIGTYVTIAVSSDLSDELVYKMTKAIYGHLEILRDSMKAFEGAKIEDALAGVVIPIHPGAKRYFNEKNVKVKGGAPDLGF